MAWIRGRGRRARGRSGSWSQCAKRKRAFHEPAVARELARDEVTDRDRSPVAACGPRQHPWKIAHALVFARPLRAGTARGPNLIGSCPNAMREAKGGPYLAWSRVRGRKARTKFGGFSLRGRG